MSRVARILRSRRARIGLAIAAAAVVLLSIGAARSALSARASLSQGRDALASGRDLLSGGDAAAAGLEFERGRTHFDAALRETDGPWLWIARRIPFVGRTPDAVHAVGAAGARVADAGSTLAAAIERIGGISALAPSHGRIPIEPIEQLAPSVSAAAAEIDAAVSELDRAPETFLLPAVASARREAVDELASLDDLLGTASSLLDELPSFLGADGPRHYFFGAQNPAELRGTGGVVGAYSILTLDDGSLGFSPFRPIQSLPPLSVEDVPGPTEEYARNYDEFRGDGRFWLAINLTPDFPTAAEAIIQAYAAAEGVRLDGVILSDPFALAALMRVTGPTTVPGLGTTLTADTVVAFTANQAYALLTDPEARKRLLGDVAKSVVDRFLEGGELGTGDVRSLARVAAEGHLLAYSADPAVQSALEETGAGGALSSEADSDLLSVIENSSGGSKVDFYEDRAVTYEIWLQSDGSARATTTVALTNHAPTSGEPRYVIGPYKDFSEAGESAQILNVYGGPGARLIRADRDGIRISVGAGSELGHPFFQDYFRTASGATSELRLSWYLPTAWGGGSLGGRYRLTLLDQPTIRPDLTTVIVHVPDGMGDMETTEAMRTQDGIATWRGTLDGRLELEVRFGPPPFQRLWRILTPG
jgi:hypothetical protein